MPTLLKAKSLVAAEKAASTQATGAEDKIKVTPSQPIQFVKSGSAAKQAVAEDEARAEAAREEAARPRRFFIQKENLGKEYLLTFLDGNLDSKGELELNVWAEHFLKVGGRWHSIACLSPNYCPPCAKTDQNAYLASAFTVFDHSLYTFTDGPKKGTTIVTGRRLLIAKRQSLALLQKLATKYSGLRGIQFCVSRQNEKSPAIGDMFEPQQKFEEDELVKELGKNDKGDLNYVPFDYNKCVPVYTLEQLADLGLGSATNVIGGESKKDLSDQL